jgi:hypothetical protein
VGLWDRFVAAFAAQLHAEDDARVALAWSSRARRTEYYRDVVLPAVAKAIGLTYRRELLLVDYALCQQYDDEGDAPVIFVESENEPWLAAQEVRKLCVLASPVRVLLTVAEWDSTPGAWPHGGMRDQYLETWRRIGAVYSHALQAPPGLVVALVGEWRPGNRLRFYANWISGPGWSGSAAEVVVDRVVAHPQPIASGA